MHSLDKIIVEIGSALHDTCASIMWSQKQARGTSDPVYNAVMKLK